MDNPDVPPSNEELCEEVLATLRDIVGDDDPAFLTALLESYLNTAPALMAHLEETYRRGDVREVGHVAHSLKSSSAMIGCSAFSSLCGDVEETCRSGQVDMQTLAANIQTIRTAYSDVEEALEMLLRYFGKKPGEV